MITGQVPVDIPKINNQPYCPFLSYVERHLDIFHRIFIAETFVVFGNKKEFFEVCANCMVIDEGLHILNQVNLDL